MAEQVNTELNWVINGIAQVKGMAVALEKLAKAQKAMNLALGKQAKTTVTYTQMLDAHRQMKSTLTETVKGVRTYKHDIKEVAERTKEVSRATKEVLLSWRSIGRVVVGSLISRGLGRLLREMRQGFGEAIEFEIRVSELRTISQQAQLSFEAWAGSVRRLSDEFGKAPLDVMEAAYQTLSNQVAEGAEAMEFTAQAQRLALITSADVTDAVQALTATINAYNLTTGDARYVSDVFFKTVELGRLRLEEIANTIGRVEVIGAQLGITLEELLASVSALTIQGIRASEAQTWLRNVIQKLIRPTDRMKEIFAEWGVASGAAAVETYTWAGVIEKLAEEANKSEDALGELGAMFNRIRATAGATGLTRNFQLIKDYLVEIKNAGPAAAEAFKFMQESYGFKLRRELQRIANFFVIDIGRKGLKAIIEIGEAFGGLTNLLKGATYTLATFAAIASGPVIVGLATYFLSAAKALWVFANALSAANTWMAALTTQVTIFGVTMSAATLGLGVALAALGALAYGLYRAHLHAKKSLMEVAQEYKDDIMPAMEEWAAREAEINADRVRSHAEVADAMRRIYLEAIADQTAALTRLHKIEEGRLALQDMIFDLTMKLGTPAEKELAIRKQMLQVQTDLNYLLKEGTPEAAIEAKEVFKDLITVYNQASTLDSKRMWVLRKWSEYTDKTGRKIIQYRWQEANAMVNINKIMEKSEKEILQTLLKYQKEHPLTSKQELRDLDAINKDLKEKAEVIETAKNRLEDYSRSQTEVSTTEIEQLGNILSLLDAVTDKQKRFIPTGREKLQWGLLDLIFGTDSYKEITDAAQAAEAFSQSIEAARGAIIQMQQTKTIDPIALESLTELLQSLPTYYEEVGPLLEVTEWETAKTALERALNLVKELNTQRVDLETQILRLQAAINLSSEFLSVQQKTFQELKDSGLESATAIKNAADTTRDSLNSTFDMLNNTLTLTKRTVDELNIAITQARILNEEIAKGGHWKGGMITRFASGGSVAGDSVHALLQPGEFIVNRNAARQFLPQLVAMNSGAARFNSGGEVVNNNIGDINISVKGGDTSEVTVRRIATELRREIKRGTVRLN